MSHFLHRRLAAGVLGLLLQVERHGGDVSGGGGVPNPDVCTHTLYSAMLCWLLCSLTSQPAPSHMLDAVAVELDAFWVDAECLCPLGNVSVEELSEKL